MYLCVLIHCSQILVTGARMQVGLAGGVEGTEHPAGKEGGREGGREGGSNFCVSSPLALA